MSNVQFLNASFINRKFVGKIQTVESVRISVKQDIVQALSIGVDSCVNSYEATLGEASFYGKTNIKFLYFDGNGISGSNYNADFTASIQSDLITNESKLSFEVVTVDSKADVNANTATLTILLEITVYAYCVDSSPYFSDGENIFVNTESVEALQRADIVNIPFVLDEEFSATRNISTVLLAESNLCAKEYSVQNGILHIAGEGAVRLTYVSDGDIVTDSLPFTFDRELEASDAMADGQLKLLIIPKNTKVRLNIAEGDVNTSFTVEIGSTVQADVTNIGVLEIVTDAYGSDCDFDFERKTVTTTLPCGSVVTRKQISASLPQEGGKHPVTALNVGAIVTNCISQERKCLVEGIVYATLLYATENGFDSEQLELPFSQTAEIDYLMPLCRSYAYVTVMNFALSEANGLAADVDLCFTIDSERDVTYSVIVDASEKPFDKSELPAIEVCIANKGETLWNLAKNLHMSEDDLVSVNPEVTNPLERDARIVVYNKI
ncbi:MAG: hypothetical protein NC099_04710 [Corallococcus sp.]|nr:hypothetical protein [Bacillota bacterium]MCM1533935.1 hypothetical protein [Corallococcus sp.]